MRSGGRCGRARRSGGTESPSACRRASSCTTDSRACSPRSVVTLSAGNSRVIAATSRRDLIASVNQAKQERGDRLRGQVAELASDALGAIRELIQGQDVPPAVRLKACHLVL